MKFEDKIKDIDRLQEKIKRHRPLNSQALQQLKEYYRIGLTYSSNAIEGNSLTESETKVVIEDGVTIGGKPLKDHFEAIGHSEAFDRIYKLAKRACITEADILDLHRLFYYRIDSEKAGKYRNANIIVSGTDFIFPPPSEIPELMRSFVEEISYHRKKKHPVEFAAYLHIRLVTIHPFVDGNGRTARLLMNLALMQEGYPITIIPPVIRGDYIAAVRESNKGKNRQFINLVSCMVYEAQREYVRLFESLERI